MLTAKRPCSAEAVPGSRQVQRGSGPPLISIVIPVLNEAAMVAACLRRLEALPDQRLEIIVVDGGSVDDTADIALPLCDKLVRANRGRGVQMNAGARVAVADTLLFLHVDTELPRDAVTLIAGGLATTARAWGRFDVRIDSRRGMLRIVERMMNLRSRMTGVATGDQAMFCRRDVFWRTGGFPEIPLLEDVALSKMLRRASAPLCLKEYVTTSGRRWEKYGVARTIVLMWKIRLAYFLGVSPYTLARWYG